MDYQIDRLEQGAEITFIDESFNQAELNLIKEKINYPIFMEQEDREQLNKYAQEIERCALESLKTKKFVRSKLR